MIKQGTNPDGLYLIRKGQCISILEKNETKEFTNQSFNKLSKKELDAHFREEDKLKTTKRVEKNDHLLFRYDILDT